MDYKDFTTLETTAKNFASDCARNYKKGVEFSVKFTFGKMERICNFPKGIKEYQYLSLSRLRESFENCFWDFMEIATKGLKDGEQYGLNITYLPLVSRDYENCVTTYGE